MQKYQREVHFIDGFFLCPPPPHRTIRVVGDTYQLKMLEITFRPRTHLVGDTNLSNEKFGNIWRFFKHIFCVCVFLKSPLRDFLKVCKLLYLCWHFNCLTIHRGVKFIWTSIRRSNWSRRQFVACTLHSVNLTNAQRQFVASLILK